VAYVCAFIAYLFDDRPSEEQKKGPSDFTDPKVWYDSFSAGNMGEISESYALQKQFTDECRTLIDVFHDVAEAIKSARREDVEEALARVQKDLPFLVGKLSEDDWADLYRRAVVDGVHEL
jgi:hypothetical protein